MALLPGRRTEDGPPGVHQESYDCTESSAVGSMVKDLGRSSPEQEQYRPDFQHWKTTALLPCEAPIIGGTAGARRGESRTDSGTSYRNPNVSVQGHVSRPGRRVPLKHRPFPPASAPLSGSHTCRRRCKLASWASGAFCIPKKHRRVISSSRMDQHREEGIFLRTGIVHAQGFCDGLPAEFVLLILEGHSLFSLSCHLSSLQPRLLALTHFAAIS